MPIGLGPVDGRASNSGSAVAHVLGTVAVGDLILVGLAVYVSGGATLAAGDVTDTLGNTYELIQSANYNGARTALYRCKSAFAGSCTVTWDNAQNVYLASTAITWTGTTASPLGMNHSAGNSATQTPSIGPNASTQTVNADALIVALLGINTGASDAGIDVPATTGYTNADVEQNGSSFMAFSFDYKVVSATGEQSAAWGDLGATRDCMMMLVEFALDTGGGAPVLSLPGVTDITSTSVRPRVTITYP